MPAENGYKLPPPGTGPQGIIRFHVKANSDRPEDQKIKNEMAKMLVDVYSPSWGRCKNSSELKKLLGKNVGALEETAQLFLQEKGIYHEVRVSLGQQLFPARSYADHFFPAGEYEALYVTIGDGAGENWWCVLFPPLCFNIFPVKTNDEFVKEPARRGDIVEAKGETKTKAENRWSIWLVDLFKGNL